MFQSDYGKKNFCASQMKIGIARFLITFLKFNLDLIVSWFFNNFYDLKNARNANR